MCIRDRYIPSEDTGIGYLYDGDKFEPHPDMLLPPKEPTYQEKRAVSYPPIQDQLDMIFHIGLDGWKESIQAIKDKIPKV